MFNVPIDIVPMSLLVKPVKSEIKQDAEVPLVDPSGVDFSHLCIEDSQLKSLNDEVKTEVVVKSSVENGLMVSFSQSMNNPVFTLIEEDVQTDQDTAE